MGLMTGSGPFGREPAGEFNFTTPGFGRVLFVEPTPKRIRVVVGDQTVADSRGVVMVHESGHQPIYYFPPEDVRADLLEPTQHHTTCPKKGEASYYTITAGDTVVENGAWYYPEPYDHAPAALEGRIAFYWKRMDHWYEEDEEVFGHPRDPYHRVDVIPASGHVRISLDGRTLAQSDRAMALFETNLPVRWYLPREDVVAELTPSETVTHCPYKGQAGYYSIGDIGEAGRDLLWFYAEPLAEAGRIGGLLCFFGERVDIEVDGELRERPQTPWSHAGAAAAQNAPAAVTRG